MNKLILLLCSLFLCVSQSRLLSEAEESLLFSVFATDISYVTNPECVTQLSSCSAMIGDQMNLPNNEKFSADHCGAINSTTNEFYDYMDCLLSVDTKTKCNNEHEYHELLKTDIVSDIYKYSCYTCNRQIPDIECDNFVTRMVNYNQMGCDFFVDTCGIQITAKQLNSTFHETKNNMKTMNDNDKKEFFCNYIDSFMDDGLGDQFYCLVEGEMLCKNSDVLKQYHDVIQEHLSSLWCFDECKEKCEIYRLLLGKFSSGGLTSCDFQLDSCEKGTNTQLLQSSSISCPGQESYPLGDFVECVAGAYPKCTDEFNSTTLRYSTKQFEASELHKIDCPAGCVSECKKVKHNLEAIIAGSDLYSGASSWSKVEVSILYVVVMYFVA